MWAKGTGEPYEAFAGLVDAVKDPDAAIVMEGDYGGQIYLTCPVRLVKCSGETLGHLLNDLDRLGWSDPSGAVLFFEVLPVGSGVGGGMGGGLIVEGVWLHRNLEKLNIRFAVEAVIRGE